MILLKLLILRLVLRLFRLPRDLLRWTFRLHSQRIALITPKGILSFGALGTRIDRLVNALLQHGMRKGDRMFVNLRDGQEVIELSMASARIGTVMAPFHEATPAHAIARAAQVLHPRLLVYDPKIANQVNESLARLDPPVDCIAVGPDREYEQWIAAAEPTSYRAPLKLSDPTGIGLTSGTTGEPKVIFTDSSRGMLALRRMIRFADRKSVSMTKMVLGIPLIGAGSGVLVPVLASGGTLIIPNSYSAEAIADAIEKHSAKQTFLTPSLLIDMLDMPDLDQRDLRSLERITYGTETMPAAKLEQAIRRFGPVFQQGYGMAEVLPPVSMLYPHDHGTRAQPAPRHVLQSAGKLVSDVRVRITDDDHKVLPPGTIGLVWIAAPTVFSGYQNSSGETGDVFRDGYLNTRDYGYVDRDGYLQILNRSYDVIRRQGETIYPRQVEEVVHDFPATKEAWLVAVGHQNTLCLSLRHAYQKHDQHAQIRSELADFLKERLLPWQLPDQIRIFPQLPRSFLGKVLRREVREVLQAEQNTAPAKVAPYVSSTAREAEGT